MILKNSNMKSFFEKNKNKKIVCYGIGNDFKQILNNFEEYPWISSIGYLLDNNSDKWGKHIQIGNRSFEIIGLEEFLKYNNTNVVIFISCSFYAEIVKQLNRISKLNFVECYIYYFMYTLSNKDTLIIPQKEQCFIPPTIHYCWFGGKELPDLYKRCIDSWYRYCPNYEIKEWNETNCDLEECLFTKQAYTAEKYAFVSDYFRLKVIYEHGGIYLDTDVEILKNLDELRKNEAFCGMEVPGKVAFGLGFGAISKHSIIEKMWKRYKAMEFIKRDGSFNEIPIPIWNTLDMVKAGMSYGNKIQVLDKFTIYPTEVLSPKNVHTGEIEITENTYAIHHYDGSWLSGERLEKKLLRQKQVEEIRRLIIP